MHKNNNTSCTFCHINLKQNDVAKICTRKPSVVVGQN